MANSSTTGRNFLLGGLVLCVGAVAAGVSVLSSPAPSSLTEDIDQLTDENKQEFNSSESNSPTANEGSNRSKGAKLTQEPLQMKEDALTPRRLVDVAPPLEEAFIPRDKVEGKKVPRYTPLFFAPTIWQVPDAGQKKNLAVDLLADGSHPLHSIAASGAETKPTAVPNAWFYKYGLEDSLCMADALQQDPDGDGFSNGEEFIAGSDPSDAASMPPFVTGDTVKLVTVGDKAVSTHLIELSSASYFDENTVNINIFSDNGQRILQHKEKKPGETFGLGDAEKGPMAKNRFTIEKIDKKTDESGNTANLIHVKDAYTELASAKEFDLVAGSRNRRSVRDVTLKFRVTAGPEKGKELTVQLGQQFDVPGFKDTHCVVTDAGKKKTQAKVSVNGGADVSVSSGASVPQEKTGK